MKDTKFQDCTVRNSSFENLDFKNGGNAFLSSRIEACRFDGANLENVALDGAVFVDCTFWGTRFKDLKLPDETWNALTAAGLLVTDGPKQHTVQTLDEALRSLTPRKAAYVARALFVDFVRKWLPAPERWPKQPAATGDAKPPADA
ncbi:pentapeptide repeat-containing protein [Caulobacter radicis]|nr:pentapeptide repeat-containing protein [Caulobacter radicis]